LSCAICETRKEKRFCLAVHGRICPVCCGREREVTLDCPTECVYLRQAREHERPRWDDELPVESLFPQVEVAEQFVYEHEQLLAGLSYGVVQRARADRTINDRDAIAALRTLAKTYETRVNSGLHYEPPTANMVQQGIADEVQKMVQGYQEMEQKQLGATRLRDSDVLKALVFLVRMAEAKTSGRPKSRAFLEFIGSRFPQESTIASPAEASRIVMP
jgi:hypothetical protein